VQTPSTKDSGLSAYAQVPATIRQPSSLGPADQFSAAS
jgi:hypothetical protein